MFVHFNILEIYPDLSEYRDYFIPNNTCLYNQENIYPCVCLGLNEIDCGYVPLSAVKQIFKNQIELENFRLTVPLSEEFIPANLLVKNKINTEFQLQCQQSTQRLTIHPNAFQASRKFTSIFGVINCDLARFNFSFLADFRKLYMLFFKRCANIHLADWTTLPLLPKFNFLEIEFMKLNEWTNFPVLHKGLYSVTLKRNLIGDAAMDRILQWLTDSPSIDTLTYLDLEATFLNEIPVKISSFKIHLLLFLGRNPIKVIRNGFITNIRPFRIDLHSCDIDTIEPGAFHGILYSY